MNTGVALERNSASHHMIVRRTLTWLIGGAAVALLSVSSRAAAADGYANVHTLGVISAVGDQLTLSYVGTTVFSNVDTPLDIEDWGVDERITKEIASVTSARFTVKPVTFLKSDYADLRPGLFDTFQSLIRKPILARPPEGIDAYVVVHKVEGQDPMNSSNEKEFGLGLYRRSVLGMHSDAIFALYAIDVVDAKTGDVIDSGRAELPDHSLFGYLIPWTITDNSIWPDSAASFAGEQKEKARVIMLKMIDDSINHALANAGLIEDSLKLVPANPDAPQAAGRAPTGSELSPPPTSEKP